MLRPSRCHHKRVLGNKEILQRGRGEEERGKGKRSKDGEGLKAKVIYERWIIISSHGRAGQSAIPRLYSSR